MTTTNHTPHTPHTSPRHETRRATLATSHTPPSAIITRHHFTANDHATTYRNAITLARLALQRADHTLDPTEAERLRLESDGWQAVARLIAAFAATNGKGV